MDYCSKFSFAVNILKYIVNIVKFVIPILLIVFVTIDLVKATIAKDDKAAAEAKAKIAKRIVYAIIIFLIPTIVSLIFQTIVRVPDNGLEGPQSFLQCYFK